MPIALQNAIFDEYLGLVEARIDAARQAGTLDLGVETIPVDDFAVLADKLLRTDAAAGATTHLLELEITRSLRPLSFERLVEQYGLDTPNHRLVNNVRSHRVALLRPARGLLGDDGERIARVELIRPLNRSHRTANQLEESNWEPVDRKTFESLWRCEADEAAATPKRERHHLATGLLLPIWDKLPSDTIRVSRIVANDGRTLLGREVPLHDVSALCRDLGLDDAPTLSPDAIVEAVMKSGKPLELRGRETLTVKRSLVNGAQRLELTGWSAARLDWYKAQGCFTEIIRYQTRLFVPTDGAAGIVARIAGS